MGALRLDPEGGTQFPPFLSRTVQSLDCFRPVVTCCRLQGQSAPTRCPGNEDIGNKTERQALGRGEDTEGQPGASTSVSSRAKNKHPSRAGTHPRRHW